MTIYTTIEGSTTCLHKEDIHVQFVSWHSTKICIKQGIKSTEQTMCEGKSNIEVANFVFFFLGEHTFLNHLKLKYLLTENTIL